MNIKRDDSYKEFLAVIIAPIVGIIVLFSYAFLYVKDEVDFVNHEVKGLNKIYKVQGLVFDIQELRGLSAIKDKDKSCIADIENIKQDIKKKVKLFQNSIAHLKKDEHLKGDFDKFFIDILHHSVDNNDFEHISKTIHDSRLFIEKISYHSNLALDSKLKSFILSQTIVITLPELIEYNGQVRGISSAIINNKLERIQKEEIMILHSKIDDKIRQLEFNINELSDMNLDIIETIYANTILAQNSLLDFVRDEIINKDKIMHDANSIFRLESNNIEFIKLLYNANYKELNNILTKRLEEKEFLSIMIILSAILSISFILFINILLYKNNQKYIKKIKLLSITDGMTKLYNRRYFDEEFSRQLKIKARLKQNLIFIMMDIDHFKQYNDTYGHQAGDDALILVAKCIKDHLKRPDDLAFRLGGEEFGVLCSNMNKKEALVFANKLRININNLKIKHSKNSASEFVTVSKGLIVIKPNNKYEMDTIYKYTDKALYEAKQNGRNQVCLYNDEL